MKKPFKVAGWSLIILLVLSGIAGIITNYFPARFLSILLYGIITPILALFTYYGFILLGKKFKSKFLVTVSWIGVILLILYSLYFIFGNLVIDIPIPTDDELAAITNQSQQNPENIDFTPLYGFLFYLLILHLIISIMWGIYTILLGAALIKISKKIRYAKTAGILSIIAGATLFIFIGYIIVLAAIIFEILLLFEASKRFESKRNRK